MKVDTLLSGVLADTARQACAAEVAGYAGVFTPVAAVVAAPEGVAGELHRRYGDVIQRISFYPPYETDPRRWAQVLAEIKAD